MTEKSRLESRLRSYAKRNGHRLSKSRARESADNLGRYQLIDADLNCVVLGSRFDANLDDISLHLGYGRRRMSI